jgi:hypothetical protein
MNAAQWGAAAAFLAGVAYIVDALRLLGPGTSAALTHLVAIVLTLVAAVSLHVVQKRRSRSVGWIGVGIVAIALVAQAVGRLSELSASGALEWLVFPLGVLVMVAGLVVYGVATWRAAVLPRWVAIGFVVIPPLAIVAAVTFEEIGLDAEYGEVLLGLLWIAVAYALWSRSGRPGPGTRSAERAAR